MIFKDRTDAGRKLLVRLFEDSNIKKNKTKVVVVSLLRGGIVVGETITNGLQAKHLPLAVAKIPAPHNPELALGAVCFDVTYLEKNVLNSLGLTKGEIAIGVDLAQEKFKSYAKKFNIRKAKYSRVFKNKLVILVDDGIATGSTVKAAILYLKTKKPKLIYLAVPVAPYDFSAVAIDKEIILHKDFGFGAVSQFYASFPQVEDDEVKKILKRK